MKKTFLALSFLSSLLLSSQALANLPIKIKQGMDYKQARKVLIKSGWQTVVMNRNSLGVPVCYDFLGGEADCQGQFEIEVCAPTGMAQCKMVFFDGNRTYLNVFTVGEEPVIDGWKKTTKKPTINRADY